MKKDIIIPEVNDVHVAAVLVYNTQFKVNEWNVYLINDTNASLETVLIVSKGRDKKKETSLLRHKIEKLPAKSFAKVEYLHEDVLALDNEFSVSYFQDSKMFDKIFRFAKNSIKPKLVEKLPIIPEKGILAK